MAVIRILWSEGLSKLQRQMQAYLSELLFYQVRCFPSPEAWVPQVDIFEIPQALIVVVTCPGAERDRFDIRLDSHFLYVKGYRTPPVRGRVYQLEGEYGPFERLIRLPFPVTSEGAEAVFEEGLLKIWLPKEGH